MIVLEKIRWKNLLSTGNTWSEVVLNESKTMLICGENGSGKSTIMDAICFVLFNKPFRKINKPQLVNDINDGDCVAQIIFYDGPTKYQVIRGIKPAIFEIRKDGELINQLADSRDYQEILEKRILQMNYKTFLQIVVLGSANWTAFMALPAAARRKVIEDLLDIEVFSVMNILLKERQANNKITIEDLDNKIAILKNTITLNAKHREEMNVNRANEIERKNNEMDEHDKEIDKLGDANDELNTEIVKLTVELSVLKKQKDKIVDTEGKITKAKRIIKQAASSISFYSDNSTCPTCTQPIDEKFKYNIVEAKERIQEEANNIIEKLNSVIKQHRKNLESFEKLVDDLDTYNKYFQYNLTKITVNQKLVGKLIKDIETLSKKVACEVVSDNGAGDKLIEVCTEKEALINLRELYNVASFLLKDNGIKTQIIMQYIPIMNQLINTYLERMEFFCQFNLDENFDEQISTRGRNLFSYDSFSQGEKMRIDLALLFTWREISRMRNAAPINLLLLDEIMDSSLDPAGTEEFIGIISQLTDDNNVIIISHKQDQISDKFDKVIVVEKHKNFSHFKEV